MWEAVYNSNASDDGLDCMAFCTIDITIEGDNKVHTKFCISIYTFTLGF